MKEILKAVLFGIAFWVTLQFGIQIGINRYRKPQTMWNHGCKNPASDIYTGTNWMVWHCWCGKSGTNAYPVESSAGLKPWFTNVPPPETYRHYRTNYFTNETAKTNL